ncbi:hypothetical protein ILUMI_20074 [Ignelater luminosus]|uniref:Uncharacterized protein n=1 Tax=Ignelater luminosus TaxID=2038154 RepID=A0A8K0CH11_IGNLU|nr:hypothetical protein ILUMI_20074 [Ignelater luminosus]
MRKYVVNHISDKIQELILWSDSCGGQNRNIKIVLLLKSILEEKPTLGKIRLRLLVSGHSFLPNDSDFGNVESALKIQQKLFSPEDYIKIMKNCREKSYQDRSYAEGRFCYYQ